MAEPKAADGVSSDCPMCGPNCVGGAHRNALAEDGITTREQLETLRSPKPSAEQAPVDGGRVPRDIAHKLWYRGGRLRSELRASLMVHPENWNKEGLERMVAEWDEAATAYANILLTTSAAPPVDTRPDPKVEEIRKRLEKITPGSWRLLHQKLRPNMNAIITEVQRADGKAIIHWTGFDACDLPRGEKLADARFIAAAPDDIRYLLSELDRLKEGLQ